jgi:pimeloyl-ACP methyl ester carboxylesterase
MPTFEPPFYPIILIRGFAMSDTDIEGASSSVFQGFEAGSTRLRQDTGPTRKPVFFESVVVRLMKDHGYDESFRDNVEGFESARPVSPRSLWVHRYYDLDDPDFSDGKRHAMEEYAVGLRRLILKVRDKLCPDAAARAEFKVHLVAHSMGGLVVRCYLQNICAAGPGKASLDPKLELKPGGCDPLVSRVFTYGTPHNGIDLRGLNVPNFGPLGFFQTGVFNRKEIRKYLRLPPAAEANDLNGAFDPDHLFCLIGTDYRDYDIAASRVATGSPGDGLVLCQNAYARGSPRAFVHRAHGGPYGMVSSEEGYQNLRRFLFGDWRVDVELVLDEVRLPDAVVDRLDPGEEVTGDYLLDVIAGVRGQILPLHQRRVSTESAVTFSAVFRRTPGADPRFVLDGKADNQSRIASLYLLSSASLETSREMLFSVRLALEVPSFKRRGHFLDNTLPGFKAFMDTCEIRIDPVNRSMAYGLSSKDGQDTPHDLTAVAAGDGFSGQIPFGRPVEEPLKSGEVRGRIVVTARPL